MTQTLLPKNTENNQDPKSKPRWIIDENKKGIEKKFRRILNKLTSTNFVPLMLKTEHFKRHIKTAIEMEQILNLVFEKALSEPQFCHLYAMFCCVMANTSLSSDNGEILNFQVMLTERCEYHFNELTRSSRSNHENSSNENTSKGVIRFIGELFRVNVLSLDVILGYLNRLVQHRCDDNLEYVCTLMRIVGNHAERVKSSSMEKYVTELNTIVNNKENVSSRIRFMIMDVLDLYRNQWNLRMLEISAPPLYFFPFTNSMYKQLALAQHKQSIEFEKLYQ